MGHDGLSMVIVLMLLSAATITDVRRREVPNWLTYGGVVGGLLTAAVSGWASLQVSLLGLMAGGLLLLPLVWLGGFGPADALLLAAVGAWFGWQMALWTAWWASVAGGILAVITWRRGQRVFPYVPAVATGTALALLIS